MVIGFSRKAASNVYPFPAAYSHLNFYQKPSIFVGFLFLESGVLLVDLMYIFSFATLCWHI